MLNHSSDTHDESIINATHLLLDDALRKNASDIHLESFENTSRIRFRLDGLLNQITEIETDKAKRIISRLKILARLDIAEKRLPQDGHFVYNEFDLRISTCPTLFGEKVVLRILNPEKKILNLNDLGLTENQLKIFVKNLKKTRGLILVTGATGSGKTVTLYSALNYINSLEKNISTIEDPVEVRLQGINQTNINPKIGFTFATALKTFLRQDPDVIMLGEIRDMETAKIAMQAAETGHMVLSTLHTDSAIEALFRLLSFGISPTEIINSVTLIINQRLIRTLCIKCNKNISCSYCTSGFKGRTGIFELLSITSNLAHLLNNQKNISEIENTLLNNGFIPLRNIAQEKIAHGITTQDEINRVLC